MRGDNENVKEVRVVPCNSNPCILKLGTNVTVEADFIAPLNTNKLSEVIKGVIRGRELPFPGRRRAIADDTACSSELERKQ